MGLYTDSSPVTSYNLSGNMFVDALLQGSEFFRYAWSNMSGGKTAITYSLPFTTNPTALFAAGYGSEITAETKFGLGETHKTLLELAFSKWEEVANLAFSEVAETDAGEVGDIRIAFSSDVAPWWGWAKLSSAGHSNAHGDIWINPEMAGEGWHASGYSLNALVHEIGHSLGLAHPFEGNIMPEPFDNRRYTIMSYTDPETFYWWNPETSTFDYLITGPMVYDIRAIQYLYGANMEFHAGNDTYSYASNVPFFKAIWDAGGKDTLDLSNFTKACIINLEPGSYSTLGFDNLDIADSLGIAFDCFIENAKGGAGADIIKGNLLGNILTGNAGADILYGFTGNDTLVGGTGADRLFGGAGSDILIGGGGNDRLNGGNFADTAKYTDATAGVTVDLAAGTATSAAGGDQANIGNDTLISIENVTGSAFADKLLGDGLANILSGLGGDDEIEGRGGADVLTGGAGNDTLDGGLDRDRANYADAAAGVVVNLSTGKAVSALSGDAAKIGLDTLISIEDAAGSAYADRLTGSSVANVLVGNAGSDVLFGLGGADTLLGGGGKDLINGGEGKDVMTGGGGSDLFIFDDADFGGQSDSTADRITDFNRTQGDRINLARVDAIATNAAADDAFTFIGTDTFTGQAGQLRYEQISANTYVQGDTTGDGVADFWIRLDGSHALMTSDFIL